MQEDVNIFVIFTKYKTQLKYWKTHNKWRSSLIHKLLTLYYVNSKLPDQPTEIPFLKLHMQKFNGINSYVSFTNL